MFINYIFGSENIMNSHVNSYTDNISDNKITSNSYKSTSSCMPMPMPMPLPLPFLGDIASGLKKTNYQFNSNNSNNHNNYNNHNNHNNPNGSNLLIINQDQLLQIRNTLKKVKVGIKDVDEKNEYSDDNESYIKTVYLDQKNNLRKVNTEE